MLREETGLKIFDYRVLRKIFGIKRLGVTAERRQLHSENFIFTRHQIFVRSIKKKTEWWGNVLRRDEEGIHQGSWWKNPKELLT